MTFVKINVDGKAIEFNIQNNQLKAYDPIAQKALIIHGSTNVKLSDQQRCYQALKTSHLYFQKGQLIIDPKGFGGSPGKQEAAEIPNDYICPITHQLMYDPVFAADGETYEREAIERHLESQTDSPLHGEPLAHKMLTPNRALKRIISTFRERTQTADQELYLPTSVIKACESAIAQEDIAAIKTLTQKEPRLLAYQFSSNQTLLDLAFQTSPQTVKAIIEFYPADQKPPLTNKRCAIIAKSQRQEGLKVLLEAYPESSSITLDMRLFEAIKHKSIDYAKALLALGADPDAKDPDGKLALQAAVDAESKALISILIQNKADTKKTNKGLPFEDNITPAQYAIDSNKPHLANHIIFQHRQLKTKPHPTLLQQQLANILAKPTYTKKRAPAAKAEQVTNPQTIQQSDIVEILNQNFQDLETLLRLHQNKELNLNGPKEQSIILHYACAGLLMRLFHLLGIANNQNQLPSLFNDEDHPFSRPTAYEYRGQLMHHLFKYRGCTLVLIKTAEQLQTIATNIKSLKNTGQPTNDPQIKLSNLPIHKIARITEGVEDVVQDQLRAVEEIDQYALELSMLEQQAEALKGENITLWEQAGLLHLAIGTLSCALGQRLKDINAYPAYQTIKNKLLSIDQQAIETTTIGAQTQIATVFEIDRLRFGHTYNAEGVAPGQASAKTLRQAAFELITPDKLLQRMRLASRLAADRPQRQEPLPLFFQEANRSFGFTNQQLEELGRDLTNQRANTVQEVSSVNSQLQAAAHGPQEALHLIKTASAADPRQALGLIQRWEQLEDAINYISKVTGKTEDAAELATLLDRLPLALTHASAYIKAMGSGYPIKRYIEHFNKYSVEIFKDKYVTLNKDEKTILTTWSITLDAIEEYEKCPLSKEVINFMAYLGQAPIPLVALTIWSDQFNKASAIDLENALKHLVDYSMVSISEEGYNAHNLVQGVSRYLLQEQNNTQACTEALKIFTDMLNLYNSDKPEHWSFVKSSVPHCEVLNTHRRELGLDRDPSAVILLSGLGRYCQTQSRLSDGMTYYQELLKFNNLDKTQRSQTLHNLGVVLQNQGKLERAQKHYQEALEIDLQVYRTRKHPEVAKTLHNLGKVLQARGKLEEAQKYYQEALEIKTQVHGTRNHTSVAKTLHNLGAVLQEQGKLEEAQKHYQEVLEIETQVYGTRNHTSVAQTLHNLGVVLHDQGKLEGAQKHYQEASEILIQVYGTRNQTDVAITIYQLGLVLQNQGKLERAQKHYQEALEIDLQVHGTRNHPSVAQTLFAIGMVLAQQRKVSAAKTYIQESIDIAQSFGLTPLIQGGQQLLSWISKQGTAPSSPASPKPFQPRTFQLSAAQASKLEELQRQATVCRVRGKYDEAKKLLQRAYMEGSVTT